MAHPLEWQQFCFNATPSPLDPAPQRTQRVVDPSLEQRHTVSLQELVTHETAKPFSRTNAVGDGAKSLKTRASLRSQSLRFDDDAFLGENDVSAAAAAADAADNADDYGSSDESNAG